MSKVLVCGSRDWTNKEIIKKRLEQLPAGTTIIHGGCRGADIIAGEVAKELGFEIEVFPASWSIYGRGAGPIRNKQMLTEGEPELVIVFHNNLEESKGTKNMINLAKADKVPVEFVDDTIDDSEDN